MRFFGKKKECVYVDPRIMEKMEQSDLVEYIEGQRRHGLNVDTFYGAKIKATYADDPFSYFLVHLTALNSGIISRRAFEIWDFTESEINAIMGGDYQTTIGLSHPTRCVKDAI